MEIGTLHKSKFIFGPSDISEILKMAKLSNIKG